MIGLINRIQDKFLCLHEWKSLVKKEYTWEEEKISLKSSKESQIINVSKHTSTTEILICSHCGKIKKIEY